MSPLPRTSALLALAIAAPALAQASKPAAPLAPAPPAAPAAAKEAAAVTPLSIGDKAPAFDISDWVKGEKLAGFEPGTITVMEFWATWCGPCKASMPHISELQERFAKDKVRFVGVSDEKLQTVTDFLGKDEWKEKTRYTLATDPDRSTYNSYMAAAGQNGIPTAFVVGRDGCVEWIGHPMRLDSVMEQVVSGTWDRAAAKAEFDASRAAQKKAVEARAAMTKARKAGDWDTVIKLMDDQIAALPSTPAGKATRNSINLQKFQILLADANRPADAYTLGKTMARDNAKDPMVLNQIAWFVVDDDRVKERNLDFALETAVMANEAASGTNAAILDTLARVWWDKGDKAKAVEWQTKAVAALKDEDAEMAEEIKGNLEKYRK
ncbi:MAG: redoxin domain-containing protein [Phycisphaerales bacterium]